MGSPISGLARKNAQTGIETQDLENLPKCGLEVMLKWTCKFAKNIRMLLKLWLHAVSMTIGISIKKEDWQKLFYATNFLEHVSEAKIKLSNLTISHSWSQKAFYQTFSAIISINTAKRCSFWCLWSILKTKTIKLRVWPNFWNWRNPQWKQKILKWWEYFLNISISYRNIWRFLTFLADILKEMKP